MASDSDGVARTEKGDRGPDEQHDEERDREAPRKRAAFDGRLSGPAPEASTLSEEVSRADEDDGGPEVEKNAEKKNRTDRAETSP
jgi:hypothetical protein